ncbi:hypothetical protein CO2235_U590036 [Cupriavidus oxalaticus]|uniref:Uncharacterized protein n=1 Tax=Cupriavidus oxalaticus TaxID=96344 RepID=A0A375FM14_9BURK|nr:hypothetical protein CO2235_U590036 [Cupriavidus oxalaticus]
MMVRLHGPHMPSTLTLYSPILYHQI